MTPGTDRADRENRLRAYYGREVAARAVRQHGGRRTRLHSEFAELLLREGRSSVLEIGCGTGQDGVAFTTAGLDHTGVDLTPESVEHCRRLGLTATVASVLELPFPDDTFEAGWTMSTLMHLAHDDLAPALAESARVLRPGAPFAVGVWGSRERGEHLYTNEFGARYFGTSDDTTLQATLRTVGTIERFDTWPAPDTDLHYQWALVRIRN